MDGKTLALLVLIFSSHTVFGITNKTCVDGVRSARQLATSYRQALYDVEKKCKTDSPKFKRCDPALSTLDLAFAEMNTNFNIIKAECRKFLKVED